MLFVSVLLPRVGILLVFVTQSVLCISVVLLITAFVLFIKSTELKMSVVLCCFVIVTLTRFKVLPI